MWNLLKSHTSHLPAIHAEGVPPAHDIPIPLIYMQAKEKKYPGLYIAFKSKRRSLPGSSKTSDSLFQQLFLGQNTKGAIEQITPEFAQIFRVMNRKT